MAPGNIRNILKRTVSFDCPDIEKSKNKSVAVRFVAQGFLPLTSFRKELHSIPWCVLKKRCLLSENDNVFSGYILITHSNQT